MGYVVNTVRKLQTRKSINNNNNKNAVLHNFTIVY